MDLNYIPLLCTRDTIIFPNIETTIDVIRDFSLNAIDAAHNSVEAKNLIVLVAQIDSSSDTITQDTLYTMGTICEIKALRRRNDYIKLTLRSLDRIRLNEVHYNEEKRYFECTYNYQNLLFGSQIEEEALRKRINMELGDVFRHRLDPLILAEISKQTDIVTYTSLLSQFCISNFKTKQEILEIDNVNTKLDKILFEILSIKEIENVEAEIDKRVRERFDENNKEYFRREKLKEIQSELSNEDDDNEFRDIDKLKEDFETKPYPENIKQKALDEIKRYKSLGKFNNESGYIMNYINWLHSIPWFEKTEDNEDLKLAAKILDEDHYGLEKVKERILEYLAVKQMTQNLKSPIICLVGPPGVGKTSLARSVARALNRNFVKISVGGTTDEAQIKGHMRTYVGAMPGRIISTMKKAKSTNPVFLIDEIDKMGTNYRGDPASAMLEVLDPEQNFQFQDVYLEEPYDLSDVLFIATANYIENIPPALKDRLEVIELSSYTELEKVNIATRHLIPKQLEANGLKASQISLNTTCLKYLIRHYTREAGVRQLERIIASLMRKAVLAILKDKEEKVVFTKELINKYLGHELYDYGNKESKNQVGVVTGLAYTQFGGDVLPIEVTYFDGKGALHMTGSLGDVMKESVEIAFSYVKANASEYKIAPDFFEKHDIHIHAPEGAVPKDGPSAGVTITTAIVSAITGRKVDKNVAMTGEVTLRGNVLPIGGLKEKSLAAHRSGIKTILFPKENVKDLDEVPKTVKDNVEFIPVENVKEVIERALLK